jgi:heme exporter protein A
MFAQWDAELVAENLSLTRGNRTLFSSLSFHVRHGEALVLRGPNGSGKTSLLRVLAGLSQPDGGTIGMRNRAWQPRDVALYLGHTNALKDDFTTAENLRDALQLDGIKTGTEDQYRALDRVGLLSRRQLIARRLSQGQKRRIGLARLTLSHKPVWLLDEPTNALDNDGVALFLAIVQDHLARGGIACIATHLNMQLAAPVRELSLGSGSVAP